MIKCFVLSLKITKFVIMIKDTELIEYRLKPIDTERIVSSEEGETAYELESVQHGSCADRSEEIEKLKIWVILDVWKF